VDFANPVFSTRRLALLQYVSASVQGPDLANALENDFVANITASPAASLSDTPEREFLSNWAQADFEPAFRTRIAAYFAALQQASQDLDAVDGWFRLAESRRRLFRRRPLAEFSLTTPRTNIPEDAPSLRMSANGGVSVVN